MTDQTPAEPQALREETAGVIEELLAGYTTGQAREHALDLVARLLAAASSADTGAGGLAEAWEAAEAALPEYDFGVTRHADSLSGAWAKKPIASMHEMEEGPPAAALHALAARLQAADEGGDVSEHG